MAEKKIDLNPFIEWQAEKKESRSVDIKVGKDRVSVWAYDHVLMEGQHVKSVDEIDLEGKKAENEKAQLERLKAKYES